MPLTTPFVTLWRSLALAVAILSLRCAAHAQTVAVDAAKIRAFVADVMRDDAIPGLAVVVVLRDGTAYAEGFGKTGRANGAVTPDTPFLLGSMSKSITALAVMQLVEEGRVDLVAPVGA